MFPYDQTELKVFPKNSMQVMLCPLCCITSRSTSQEFVPLVVMVNPILSSSMPLQIAVS